MSYVVNNHLNNLYLLSNKAVGLGKNPKLINVGPTSIQEARVHTVKSSKTICIMKENVHFINLFGAQLSRYILPA